MKSKLLFTIKCPEELKEIFDIHVDQMRIVVITGYHLYARAKGEPLHGLEYKSEVSELGPEVFAVPEYRPAKVEELHLVK